MALSAFQTQYRDEWIAQFEQRKSLLLGTVTTEAVIKGNQAVFLVAGSGNAAATKRGITGRIQPRGNDNQQNTAILEEWNDLVTLTGFNIFSSQGNQKQIMQEDTLAVINRKIDELIIAQLGTATGGVGGAGQVASVAMFQRGRVRLTNESVPWDGYISMLCQPSFLAALEQDSSRAFASADFVKHQPYAGEDMSWRDMPTVYKWRNATIIEHPGLPGQGTDSEQSYLYHKSSMGHAANVSGMENVVGYDEEQGYTYARCSMIMGSKLLQDEGVIPFTHDTLA